MAEVRCDECKKVCDSRGIGPHQRATGHVGKTPLGHSKALVPVGKKPVRRKYVRKPKSLANGHMFTELQQFKVITDSTGGIWLAERIR